MRLGDNVRMRTLTHVFTVAWALFAPSVALSQYDAASKREEAAIRAVQDGAKFREPLRTVPIPSMSDSVVFLATRGLTSPIGAKVPTITFYRVEPASYQIDSGKVVGVALDLNVDRWLVAVALDDGATYLLQGSHDPVKAFNQLISDQLHLDVEDDERALHVFFLFWQASHGDLRSLVSDELRLESVAAEDFRSRFSAKTSVSAYREWVNRFPMNLRRKLAPPIVVRVMKGFEVRYFCYDSGSIYQQTLHISVNGTVAKGNSILLFHYSRD